MDYWNHLEWFRWKNWHEFEVTIPANAGVWLIESNGSRAYSEVKYGPDDYIILGRETAGLPSNLLEKYADRWLRIPMFNVEARSLNLSNCAALVLYEALRQQGFANEVR